MLFTSLEFIELCLLTLILYYLVKEEKQQIVIIFIASCVFYAWSFPFLLLLLLISIAINAITSYLVAISIEPLPRKIYATLGVGTNLLILSFFKYSPLFSRTFFDGASSIGQFLLTIPLPIGISFFTFQGISLVVDTFKQSETKEVVFVDSFRTHLVKSSIFISFFPQLVAGPIVKAHEFLPQIQTKLLRQIDWEFCFKTLIKGYFLKMVIADNLKDYTTWMIYPYFETKPGSVLVSMLFGYSMQIFADFAGYSLIAIGIAGLFGYRLKDNFLFPYISTTFSEFWRRWHISLSSFLKEYLYIPLGGNQKGKIRTYINLMLTMLLGGLWHGAAWSYLVWGGYHGGLLAIERMLKGKFTLFSSNYRFTKILKGLWIFGLVSFGWLLFRLPEFSHAILYVKYIFTNKFSLPNLNIKENLNVKILFFISMYSLPILCYHAFYLIGETKRDYYLQQMKPLLYACMLFLIITNSGSAAEFIYFQF